MSNAAKKMSKTTFEIYMAVVTAMDADSWVDADRALEFLGARTDLTLTFCEERPMPPRTLASVKRLNQAVEARG